MRFIIKKARISCDRCDRKDDLDNSGLYKRVEGEKDLCDSCFEKFIELKKRKGKDWSVLDYLLDYPK